MSDGVVCLDVEDIGKRQFVKFSDNAPDDTRICAAPHCQVHIGVVREMARGTRSEDPYLSDFGMPAEDLANELQRLRPQAEGLYADTLCFSHANTLSRAAT